MDDLEEPAWFARRWDFLIIAITMFSLTWALIQREYALAGMAFVAVFLFGRQIKLAESAGLGRYGSE